MSVLSPKRVVFSVVATAFLAVNAFAVNPSPRDHARMVFDPSVGEAILFGGTSAFDKGTQTAYDSNETWAWTGTRWTQRFPAHSPAARSAHAMSYDSLRNRIMLFGGRYQTGTGTARKLNLLGDTWVYENGDWRELALDPAPSPRHLTAMAYDPIRDRTILYGGSVFAADGTTTEVKADTWEFDGTRWTQVNNDQVKVGNPLLAYDASRDQMILLGTDTEFKPHMYRYDPSAKSWTEIKPEKMLDCVNDAALVYETNSRTLLLIGGVCSVLDNFTAKTWRWDGTNWNEVKTVTAVARTTGSAMAFDSLRETAVFYGGTEHLESEPRSVTLLFSRGNWHFAILHTRPSPRSLFGFTGDLANNTVWLFGGVGEYNNVYAADLWGYRNGQWFVKNAKTPPQSCVGVTSAFDIHRSKLVYVCWPETGTGLDMEVYEFDGNEFKNISAKDKPDARRFGTLVYDENLKKTVFFGGWDGQDYKDDTWTWDGTNWTEVRRDRPPNRGVHAMWYDPLQKRTILYGGIGRENIDEHVKRFSDMWAFNGNGWTKLNVANTPGERVGAQYAVDPNTGKVLLFGGLVHVLTDPKNERSGRQFYDNETWQWDGASSTWTKLAPATSPSARQNGRIAYDPIARRLVLFGGFAGFFYSDLWYWTGTTWEVRPENGARRRPNSPGPIPQPPTGSDMF